MSISPTIQTRLTTHTYITYTCIGNTNLKAMAMIAVRIGGSIVSQPGIERRV